MGAIGVVHLDLMSKGGGESVSMNVLEALQDDYDVTLLTFTDPDFETLNEYYHTNVNDVTVKQPGQIGPLLHRYFGLKYYILQNALLGRYVRRHADQYDLLISTINELGLPAGSIEYVHFPFDWNTGLDSLTRDEIFHPTVKDNGLYERVCTLLAGVTNSSLKASRLLANSAWTARAVQRAYGVQPEIVHPPVDTRDFVSQPWADREPGFVTIGRIERSKRLHTIIDIIDGVRNHGYDTHLHIIGPTIDTAYCQEITEMAARRSYVEVEGELSRNELIDRISRHRYGIHGKRHEHFGMAVAEIAAGGAIPFVPATGGPSVIINDRPELQYHSPEEAVRKITDVLSSRALQSELRVDPTSIRRRFGRDRFQDRIVRAVRDALDEAALGPVDAAVPVKPATD